MFCKMAHFQCGSSGCSQAQPLDTASVGSLPWAAGHLSATCSALSLGSNVSGQPCTCSEGHTWLLLHHSVPNCTWPGWVGPVRSGSDPPGSPSIVGAVPAVSHWDLAELLSFLLGSVTTNAVFSWFPTINCDARLLWSLPATEGHGARLAMGLDCAWGWGAKGHEGLGSGLAVGSRGCGVTGLWCWAGHGAVRPGCPEACPEVCTGSGAMGPGCPLCCGQQVPTLPSPGSADVSYPCSAQPCGHCHPVTGCQGDPELAISPLGLEQTPAALLGSSKGSQSSQGGCWVLRHLLGVGIGAGLSTQVLCMAGGGATGGAGPCLCGCLSVPGDPGP